MVVYIEILFTDTARWPAKLFTNCCLAFKYLNWHLLILEVSPMTQKQIFAFGFNGSCFDGSGRRLFVRNDYSFTCLIGPKFNVFLLSARLAVALFVRNWTNFMCFSKSLVCFPLSNTLPTHTNISSSFLTSSNTNWIAKSISILASGHHTTYYPLLSRNYVSFN